MDPAALGALYEEHGWHVFRRSLAILKSKEEARDVCQDVFVRLLEAESILRKGNALVPWLFKVTTNACIDRLRLRKHHDPAALDALIEGRDLERHMTMRDLALRMLEGFRPDEQ